MADTALCYFISEPHSMMSLCRPQSCYIARSENQVQLRLAPGYMFSRITIHSECLLWVRHIQARDQVHHFCQQPGKAGVIHISHTMRTRRFREAKQVQELRFPCGLSCFVDQNSCCRRRVVTPLPRRKQHKGIFQWIHLLHKSSEFKWLTRAFSLWNLPYGVWRGWERPSL